MGLDDLWLTDADYVTLEAPGRGAIRDWVSQGGHLYVCAQTADPALRAGVGLPATGDEADASLGHVRLIAWDGKPLPLESLVRTINRDPSARVGPAFNGTEWPMSTGIGHIPLNAPFLIGFIVLFALVVGPLNLFWFAGAARRHRLFWTTPLLSVGASLRTPFAPGFFEVRQGERGLLDAAARFADARQADFKAATTADTLEGKTSPMPDHNSREGFLWPFFALSLGAVFLANWAATGRGSETSPAPVKGGLPG